MGVRFSHDNASAVPAESTLPIGSSVDLGNSESTIVESSHLQYQPFLNEGKYDTPPGIVFFCLQTDHLWK